MSAKIFISPSIKAIPQPDFEASRPTDNGGWQASQTFLITKGKLDDPTVRLYFGLGKSIVELDPSTAAIWSFLRVRKISPMTELGGWERIRVDFGGFPEVDANGNTIDPTAFSITYAMRGQVADGPITDHPKFKALPFRDQIQLGKLMDGSLAWEVTNTDEPDPSSWVWQLVYADDRETEVFPQLTNSADARAFADKIASGVSTYRRGGFTWSKRWDSSLPLTSGELNLIGKIVSSVPGSPPSPQSRNWMLVSAQQEQNGEAGASGTTYMNELIFELSEEDGWDSFLQS